MANPVPPGLIGLACGELGRYSDFIPSIVALCGSAPPGTGFQKVAGLGPAGPFNEIGKSFLANPKYQWLLLTNDDNTIPPGTIQKMWKTLSDPTLDAGAVTGLYFERRIPFQPIAFDGYAQFDSPPPDSLSGRWYQRFFLGEQTSGLVNIVACGDGCLMVSRRVMEVIGHPWWEYGETVRGAADHDMVFSRKIRETGARIYLDLDIRIDHIANFVVRPEVDPDTGKWVVSLVDGHGRKIVLPAARHDPSVSEDV